MPKLDLDTLQEFSLLLMSIKIQGNSVELIVDGDEKLVKSFNQSFKIVFMDWIKSDIELLKIKIKKI